MGRFVLKNISFTLTEGSLQDAIDEVNKLKDDLSEALAELARFITEEKGVEFAKMQIAQFPAIDTGELYNSITGTYNKSDHSGTIYSGAYYAVYVEFGTGIIGDANPHPQAQVHGWEYDINGHGNAGWLYPEKDGPESNAWAPGGQKAAGVNMRWTRGMPARPFMYNTLRDLEREVEKEGGRIIAEYIP